MNDVRELIYLLGMQEVAKFSINTNRMRIIMTKNNNYFHCFLKNMHKEIFSPEQAALLNIVKLFLTILVCRWYRYRTASWTSNH